MIFLVYLMPFVIVFGCVLLGEISPTRSVRWWFLRAGLVPFISTMIALYILWTPTPIPPDWDPMKDPNYGRLDFIAAMFFGFYVPALLFAALAPLTWAILKLRSKK